MSKRSALQDIKNVFRKNTKEFCKNSTLHGLTYLKKTDLYASEKLFFVGSITLVSLVTCYFTFHVYWKYSISSPVIVSIKPEMSRITDHPFPAMTICNLNQVYKSKAKQYSINSTEYTKIQLLCKNEVNVSAIEYITEWNDLNEFIRNTSQPCLNMLRSCSYGGVKYECDEIFHDVITDEGLCCTFNMEHPYFMYHPEGPRHVSLDNVFTKGFEPVEWSIEGGYPKDLPEKYYPQKAKGIGETLGLTVVLDVEADQYYCSSMNHIGFKMALHNPTESPTVKEVGLLLPPGYETKASIEVEKIEADPELRDLSVRYRMCYFEDEYPLKIFTAYTERNCQSECVANMVYKSCGCIKHFMPAIHNATTCSIVENKCVERAHVRSLRVSETEKDCYDTCLPSCTDAIFQTDFFSTPLSQKGFVVAKDVVQNLTESYIKNNIAIVHIFFKSFRYFTLKQTELVSPTDFLANIGGIVCLFMGFSFITIAEFVFYGLMRPSRAFWIARRNAKRETKRKMLWQKLAKPHQHRYKFSKRKLNIVQDYTSTVFFCTIAQKVDQTNSETFSKNNDNWNLQCID